MIPHSCLMFRLFAAADMVRVCGHYVKWGLTSSETAIECASLTSSWSVRYAGVAHLVERDVANVQVVGSSPITRSNTYTYPTRFAINAVAMRGGR